jgi:hypothetical protein
MTEGRNSSEAYAAGAAYRPQLDPDPLVPPGAWADAITSTRRQRIRAALVANADVLLATASLVVIGWILPAGDRFGYLIALAVGFPWALLVLQHRDVE